MIIDCHTHAFPEAALRAMHEFYPELISFSKNEQGQDCAIWAQTPLPFWNAERRIQKMQQANIDMEVLQNPIIYNGLDENSAELCKIVNDSLLSECKNHPEYFRMLASLPLNDIEQSIEELKRVMKLGASGVVLPSNVQGDYFESP